MDASDHTPAGDGGTESADGAPALGTRTGDQAPYAVRIAAFEGPLEVLLGLIEERKLEVTRISLAEVTNQFIAYVQASPIPPGMVADFIAVASRLLLLKTKALLPFLVLTPEEEEELVDLEARLKLLARYREIAKHLRKLERARTICLGREGTVSTTVTFYPPENIGSNDLHRHFKRLADEFAAFFAKEEYAKATLGKVVSLEERIEELLRTIEHAFERRFSDIIPNPQERADVIITFLAMLELVKQRIIMVRQDDRFGDITLHRHPDATFPIPATH